MRNLCDIKNLPKFRLKITQKFCENNFTKKWANNARKSIAQIAREKLKLLMQDGNFMSRDFHGVENLSVKFSGFVQLFVKPQISAFCTKFRINLFRAKMRNLCDMKNLPKFRLKIMRK